MMATKASLTCSICLRRFRKPRTLPCLHSYCEDCLIEYAPSGTPILMCPLCQEKIKIPNGDVREFKLDFRLQSMVEDAHRFEREAGIVSEVQVCNCCKDEGEAIAKCEMCKQILCKFGLKAHENLAGLRDHVVKSLTDSDILTSGDLLENQTGQVMANPESIDQNEEEEEEEVPKEKRAILISNLPRLQYSPQRIRDILTIHFQKKRNGGGDVDRVLYPLGGCPRHAIVIFTHRRTCDSAVKFDQLIGDFQAKLLIEPFPQPYKTVVAQLNAFYWNLVPRLTTTKLIDEISKMLGKHNLQVRGHRLTEVSCTMNQLDQVQSAIIKAVALSDTSHTSFLAIERGIFIKNIPYLTEETQQLRDELKKHLEIEGTSQLQTLLCPIKGNASEAIAIFKTSEDRELYLRRSDKSFFGEQLDVVKLPAVFNRINACLEDFFTKIIKHLGIQSLRSKLQSTCGQDLVVTSTVFTGNAQHLRVASTTVLEIIGLSEANQIFSSSFDSTVVVVSPQPEITSFAQTDASTVKGSSGNNPAELDQAGPSQMKTRQITCGRCYGDTGLKHLEGCNHTFCEKCTVDYVSPNSRCLTCNALYCVVSGRMMKSTMTYYIRTNLSVSGGKFDGAIVIDYNFPDGIVRYQKLKREMQYKGNTFTAYLPNSAEGIEVVWLLRNAFIRGKSFKIDYLHSGLKLEVMWSGQITHKYSCEGGIVANGYPDPGYLTRVKDELRKCGIVSSLSNESV
ncbi:uncharacterized protein [Amphiura filiformis]|uniref:uncharacterized protein n=1 Tax=Amphiura filiformis TaxID=82378 RepID=UPI003B21117B